jgi:hypothetical protein
MSFFEKVCAVVVVVGMLNFVVFVCAAIYLGGDAVNGKVENARYYLFGVRGESGHRVYTEVSKSVFTYSKWHVYSLVLTWPLTIAAGCYGWNLLKKRIPSLSRLPAWKGINSSRSQKGT